MHKSLLMRTLVIVLLCLGWVASAVADVKLPGVFGDHMVLQCDQAIPVWGWGAAGEIVTVSLGSQTQTVTTGSNGRWCLKLNPVKAGGPFELKVVGKNTILFSDVLIGEVWLCSGQSNMALLVKDGLHAQEEILKANYPNLRMLSVGGQWAATPQQDSTGAWAVCDSNTVGKFSATAYFFGRELHERLGVPVGLVHASVGGSAIQSWTSLKAQQAVPELARIFEAPFDVEAAKAQFAQAKATWDQEAAEAKAQGKPFTKTAPRMTPDPMTAFDPSRLYNGMIAPLIPYAMRGVIWYQGESNDRTPKIYGLQLRTLIASWRQEWQQGDFPFFYVQLPNIGAPNMPSRVPSQTNPWSTLREEMRKTLAVTNTGMAVIIGDFNDCRMHPKNKQVVGYRLAQCALAKTYDKQVIGCGPLYKAIEKMDGKIVVHFDYAEGGLVISTGDKLKGFAVAGDDQKFVWADATVDGQTVVVSSAAVKQPVAVRYAWAGNPECNLANTAGLAASPFRSDNWDE